MVNVGVVGAGFMGETHGTAYQQIENAVQTAICEKNEKKGSIYAEKYGCKHYEDIEEMLCSCKVDVVDICVPTFMHEEIAIKAAKAGKNIICEKPVSLKVESLDRILSEVHKAGVKMYVGQVVRFWPEYVRAKELIENGELGEIKSYYAARLSEHQAWSEWYRKVENSGGGLLDLHLHDIDYACSLFGKPYKVYAIGEKNAYGCWNHVSTMITFENGRRVTIEGILEMAQGYPFSTILRIVGSNKVYEYSMRAGKNLENIAGSQREAYLYGDNKIEKQVVELKDAYLVELQHFINCFDGCKDSNIINMKQVREVLCTIRAINKSLELKQEVEVSYK